MVLIAVLGVFAGQSASRQARDVHRADRLALQVTLAGLTDRYILISAAEVQTLLRDLGPWSGTPGDPATAARLAAVVERTRALEIRSGRLTQVAVVALLLIAGTGLVALHRKRVSALTAAALRDDLTGVWNRRGWQALATHELHRARRLNEERVLLFVDLDGLKQVNDVLGHREGDRAIVDAAAVLTAASRSTDLVGRLGGDEFVLLLAEGSPLDVARRRVADALEAHNATSTAGFDLRLSLGAEVWLPQEGCTLDELVRRADAAMYADKSARPTRHAGLLREPVGVPVG